MAGNKECEWGWGAIGGYYLRYAGKSIIYHILCGKMSFKIAVENRILVLVVLCGVERNTLSPNQSLFVRD